MKEQIAKRLLTQWETRKLKIDWMTYEQLIHDICHSDLSVEDQLRASKEALDAFTGRGHFDDYLTTSMGL